MMEMVGLSVEKRVNRRYVLMIDFQDRFWVLTLEIFGDSQNVNWDKLGKVYLLETLEGSQKLRLDKSA